MKVQMNKNIPALTAEQMSEVDRLMIEVYHIDLLQMMENAGRNLADCAQSMVNIGVLHQLYKKLNIRVGPLFRHKSIINIF